VQQTSFSEIQDSPNGETITQCRCRWVVNLLGW